MLSSFSFVTVLKIDLEVQTTEFGKNASVSFGVIAKRLARSHFVSPSLSIPTTGRVLSNVP